MQFPEQVNAFLVSIHVPPCKFSLRRSTFCYLKTSLFFAHNVIKYFLLKALQKLKLILVAWTERETSVVRVADPQIIYGPYFPSVWKDYKYAFFISQGNSSILSIPLWLLYRENIWWKQEYSCKKDFIPTCFSNQLLLVPENSHCR